ncbi:MAG: ABC transporter ATP-binding protein [Deltaproteobacteria bacterium]|nr:MAG: ABC transporter ATP-binding protein [Deltaproteobacteria bacterium]
MSSRLHLDIEKRLNNFELHVSLEIDREIVVLFGPSGAGKTTTLDALAGLLVPDAGRITFDGITYFQRNRGGKTCFLPARKRGVGYVFQQLALFPHLTVLDNVAFALRRRRDAHRIALQELERMHIDHLAERYPHEISGGQRQRVALARAMAARPGLLLLDEPFSALDHAVRQRLQRDLRRLQREMALTVLCVTHDLEDAFAIGDRLALMREGRIEQVGPIESVFHRPATPEGARILGIRNLLRARVTAASAEALLLDWEGLCLAAPPEPREPGSIVSLYIRPEDIKLIYPDRPLLPAVQHNRLSAEIVSVTTGSRFRSLWVRLPNAREIEVHTPLSAYAKLDLRPGREIRLSLRREALILLDPPEDSRTPSSGDGSDGGPA